MRRVLYSVAASLDGFIAGPGGEFDWIPMDPAIDWSTFMSRFDTALMGRRTYEIAAGRQSGALLLKMRTYVFSRTLRSADHPKVTIVAQDGARLVGELRDGLGVPAAQGVLAPADRDLVLALLGHADHLAVVPGPPATPSTFSGKTNDSRFTFHQSFQGPAW